MNNTISTRQSVRKQLFEGRRQKQQQGGRWCWGWEGEGSRYLEEGTAWGDLLLFKWLLAREQAPLSLGS